MKKFIEMEDKPRECPYCGPDGTIWDGESSKVCPHCNGSHFEKLNKMEDAELDKAISELRMTPDQWLHFDREEFRQQLLDNKKRELESDDDFEWGFDDRDDFNEMSRRYSALKSELSSKEQEIEIIKRDLDNANYHCRKQSEIALDLSKDNQKLTSERDEAVKLLKEICADWSFQPQDLDDRVTAFLSKTK